MTTYLWFMLVVEGLSFLACALDKKPSPGLALATLIHGVGLFGAAYFLFFGG